MRIVRTVSDLRSALDVSRQGLRPIALVPTMGALHEGHLALIRAAHEAVAGQDAGLVAASIFVNPLQFENGADLARYPRCEAQDLASLERAGCDVVWMPSVDVMYPPAGATIVEVAGPALGWEGAARPGHFRGVATVVAKLFGQVRPSIALFGEKDWQQLQVIRRMAADLVLLVEIRGVATMREPDGLAMSSRNRVLTAPHRALAPRLHAAMQDCAASIQAGELASRATEQARRTLEIAGFVVEYLALVDGDTLIECDRALPGARLLAAAALGTVRLLDNIAAR
jgi:pantoate--beta-alanine ligase